MLILVRVQTFVYCIAVEEPFGVPHFNKQTSPVSDVPKTKITALYCDKGSVN